MRIRGLRGETFGRLVVLGQTKPPRTDIFWSCRCACGRIVSVGGQNLRSGNTESCGCLRRDRLRAKALKHGGAGSVEYRAWINAKNRCYNPQSADYPDYGGRGIGMYQPWRSDFAAFRAAVGPKPSPAHSLDRRDVNKGYEPGNVRWATSIEQANNRRSNHFLRLPGDILLTCADSDRALSACPGATKQRKRHGWTDQQAATKPLRGPHQITMDGVTQSLTKWAKQLKIPPETIHKRLRLGWSNEEAIRTPVNVKFRTVR